MSSSLRKGWTTGACAAAAAAAAYRALLGGRFPDPVAISLPRGQRPEFALSRGRLDGVRATAGVIKDAGDDPDVTHGAEIVATLEPAPAGTGIAFRAGEGVGTVTRPGLAVAVGEPAINPAPRRIMADALRAAAEPGAAMDLTLTISVTGGEKLAQGTRNHSLGILGGLSILGTTGVVIPYSCSAWIVAVRCAVDVARTSGIEHLVAATGVTSGEAARSLLGLPETALIEMGDFAGGLLKYLRRNPVPRLTIAGGFAKMCKLAQGHLDLRAAASAVDMDYLAGLLEVLGASPPVVGAARDSDSAAQVLDASRQAGLALGQLVARRARETALATLAGGIAVEVLVFDRAGELIGGAGPR